MMSLKRFLISVTLILLKLAVSQSHDFGSTDRKNGHHWKAPFMLITMVQIPASNLIPCLRYLRFQRVYVSDGSGMFVGWD